MKDHSKPKPCPSCGLAAPRMMPESLTGSFSQELQDGPVPQNTGVSQLDTHIDRVIGASAKKGWEVAERRLHDKRQVLEDHPEASGQDLSRNPDGTYRVLTADERGVHERAMNINNTAMSLRQKINPEETSQS